MNEKTNKYLRPIREVGEILGTESVLVDVYEVIEAFNVTCPARQHAIKKVLCSGIRGKGDAVQDLIEARDALNRAIEMEMRRVNLAKLETVDSARNGDLVPGNVPSELRIPEPEAVPESAKPRTGNSSEVRGGFRKGSTTRK